EERVGYVRSVSEDDDDFAASLVRGIAGNERLAECKASASNLRRIQVKDIIKEVEDYLKTYSSVEMDISSYVEGIRCGFKDTQMWQYYDYSVTL
ncbi:hypothetical protein Tco_0950885, partial [Tanacetum coccineum]